MSQSDFVSRGQALVAAGQFQEAVKVCRLGLLGRPTTVEGRVVLGQALLALKRFDEVLAEMRVALDLDHTSIAAQLLRAEALLRKGDTGAAIEALHTARQTAPGDPRILQLLAEAEHGGRSSVAHPSAAFVGQGDVRQPRRPDDFAPTFTAPTSLQSPGSGRRSSQRRAAQPEPFAGEESGTVEVDPEMEGVEVERELDFDALASPPRGKKANRAGARGPSTVMGKQSAKRQVSTPKQPKHPTEPLELSDLKELNSPEPRDRVPLPGVRDVFGPGEDSEAGTVAVRQKDMPELPTDIPGGDRSRPGPVPPPRGRPLSVPPPRGKPVGASPYPATVPQPPPAPLPPVPRPPIAATLSNAGVAPPVSPFAATQLPFAQPQSPFSPAQPHAPFPPPPQPFVPPPFPAQGQPFSQPFPPPNSQPPHGQGGYGQGPPFPPQPYPPPGALNPAQQQTAGVVDQLFPGEGGQQGWARAPAVPIAGANEPTQQASELDPKILALMAGSPPPGDPMHAAHQPVPGEIKTGVRRDRSQLKVVLFVVAAVLLISGGVLAGFMIRSVRLEKQIVAARKTANELAKPDTWSGWTKARDSFAAIVQAQSTARNRAALARARALIAYEFGDGYPDAKAAVAQLGQATGLDANVAAAFIALAQGDVKAAKAATDAALQASANDPMALYVAGQAALLAGDPITAIKQMKAAYEKDARPLFGIGLARAHAAAYSWDEAITTLDKVLAGHTDHPATVIARADVLAPSGRIVPNSPLGNEVHAQLERIIAEGKRPIGEQQHGVSPAQVAFADLALAYVDFTRGDVNAAHNAISAAAKVNLDDQLFAEEAVDTLYRIGDLALARSATDNALKQWRASRRVQLTHAAILLAQGRAPDAIDIINKDKELAKLPDALALRGQAQLSRGDPTSAASDFDAVLKMVPHHEAALVGRTWLDLANGDIDAATTRIASRFNPKGSSSAITTAYAATLRYSTDPAQRDKAKELLQKIVQGPPSVDVARAQLELGRIYRDTGDLSAAREAYAEASRTGSIEAKLESALLAIDERAPQGGREAIDALLKEAGDRPPPPLVIEGARARMLDGDHAGAAQLLDLADKMPTLVRWKLDRERGRFALRKSDFEGAVKALERALDGCGSDNETFLLAADAALATPAGAGTAIAEKVKKLAPDRLKGKPELDVVTGKLAMLAQKPADAEAAYKRARDALKASKASSRRLAQADFGLALVTYVKPNGAAEAQRLFELVMAEDPSVVDAYIFLAELTAQKRRSFDFAQKAAHLNPDYPYAWLLVGRYARQLGDARALADAIARLQTIAPNGPELKELKR